MRRKKKPFFRFFRASASNIGKNKHANARNPSTAISQVEVKRITPAASPKIRRATQKHDKVFTSASHFTWRPVVRTLIVGCRKCRRRDNTKYNVEQTATKKNNREQQRQHPDNE